MVYNSFSPRSDCACTCKHDFLGRWPSMSANGHSWCTSCCIQYDSVASGQMWKFGRILGLFDDLQSGKIFFIFWVSGYLSLMLSMGILWMIPVLSKRISRLFAGLIIGTAVALSFCSVPWLGLHKYSHLSDTAFQRTAQGIGLFFFLCLPISIINIMDTYTTCLLLKTNRAFFKKKSKITRGMIRQSSARSYKPESRIFFRAFRKCEILQYMFPLTEPDGELMHTSIFMGSAMIRKGYGQTMFSGSPSVC